MSELSLAVLAAMLLRGRSEIGDIRSTALVGRARLDEGLRTLVALSQGSESVVLGEAVERLITARDRVEHALAILMRGDDGLRDYMIERRLDPGGHRDHPAVRDVWDQTRARPATPATEPPEMTPEEARRRAIGNRREFFDSVLPDAEIRRLLGDLAIKTSWGDGEPTRGVWIDVEGATRPVENIRPGQELDLRYIQAEQHWRVITEQVTGRYLWGLDTVRHAEVIAAVQIVTEDIRHGTIVINHPDGPCNGRAADCEAILGGFLPRGTSLAIHWPGGFMLVHGRGNRIAP